MIIKSSSNLCKNYQEFSDLAHATSEPIYITSNGEGDLVLLSIEAYEKLINQAQTESVAQKQEKEKNIMTTFVLGNVLKEMYSTAPRGQQVTSIHTFAVFYAKQIEENRISKKEILRVAGLPESYQTEISKGMNLAEYVDVKSEQKNRIQLIEANYL